MQGLLYREALGVSASPSAGIPMPDPIGVRLQDRLRAAAPRQANGEAALRVDASLTRMTCPICDTSQQVAIGALQREGSSCAGCGSGVRWRAIAALVSRLLHGRAMPIADWPARPDIHVVGMTDFEPFAAAIANRVNYLNTFYTRAPQLDIVDLAPEWVASTDILISSEVFEHVAPPVQRAFDGAFRMLRPGGALVLTVPFTNAPETREHFPRLHDYALTRIDGRPVLRNVTADGTEERFDDLVFHGGEGFALEMRVFGREALLQNLRAAGFVDITVADTPDLAHGVLFREPWSLPIVAFKPAPPNPSGIPAAAAPMIGEYAWHSFNFDTDLKRASHVYHTQISNVLNACGLGRPGTKVLEVGAYAHVTGYLLERDPGARVTLSDISMNSLRVGRRTAAELGLLAEDGTGPELVAADFHSLPFVDGAFDLVFLCSTLHHTWRWWEVARELQRVLAPGGVLYLENEPCLRTACCYAFRTNREEEYTPFERKLDELGLLRTIAEPYLGSRPETLFGMIENQIIPLEQLFEVFTEGCETLSVELSPKPCMGALETGWVAARDRGAEALADLIVEQVTERCQQAEEALDDTARRLGFRLPTAVEIRTLARRTAEGLVALPDNPTDAAYLRGMLSLFGGGVRMVLKRRPASLDPADPTPVAGQASRQTTGPTGHGRLNGPYPVIDGVVCGFAPDATSTLVGREPMLPPFQEQPDAWDALLQGWRPHQQKNGVMTALISGTEARILRPKGAGGPAVIVLRGHCRLAEAGPFRVVVRDGETVVAERLVHASEAMLVSRRVSDPASEGLRVSLEGVEDGTPAPDGVDGHFVLLNAAWLPAD